MVMENLSFVSDRCLNTVTIWLFDIAMERSTIFKNGKPSISVGHLYHGKLLNNQRVHDVT